MDDKRIVAAEKDEERVLLSRAKPIQDRLDMARSRLSYLDAFNARMALGKLVRCLEIFPVGERGFGGIGIDINVKPIDSSSSLGFDELPGYVADIKGLEYVLRRGVLGFEREGSKPVPMLDRLYILANLCSRRSVIGTPVVKVAAEEAFLIVVRKWLEDVFAEYSKGKIALIFAGWDRFYFTLDNAIKIAESVPKRDGEKLEFMHKVADVGQDVKKTIESEIQSKLRNQADLTVDAPAFAKRPVPEKPAIPRKPEPLKTKG